MKNAHKALTADRIENILGSSVQMGRRYCEELSVPLNICWPYAVVCNADVVTLVWKFLTGFKERLMFMF